MRRNELDGTQSQLQRFRIVIEENARRSTHPVPGDVSEVVYQEAKRESRIVVDRIEDVEVKNEHVIRARELPITLDRRARKRRLQGLLEEAPALRRLVALDRQKEARIDRRRR
jgi:hypothetical protein